MWRWKGAQTHVVSDRSHIETSSRLRSLIVLSFHVFRSFGLLHGLLRVRYVQISPRRKPLLKTQDKAVCVASLVALNPVVLVMGRECT